jgi:hypothetical protein
MELSSRRATYFSSNFIRFAAEFLNTPGSGRGWRANRTRRWGNTPRELFVSDGKDEPQARIPATGRQASMKGMRGATFRTAGADSRNYQSLRKTRANFHVQAKAGVQDWCRT